MSKAIIILKLFLNINDFPWQWETALKKDIPVAFEIMHILWKIMQMFAMFKFKHINNYFVISNSFMTI